MTDSENISNHDEFYLLRQIPQVLRARDFHLYLSDNKRLIDLWLNGGAAVMGHTPPNLLREIKNTASRGLYAPYPHFTERRLIKALTKIIPGRAFRIYAAPPPKTWNADLHELKKIKEEERINIKLWRPFVNSDAPFKVEKELYLIPVIPGIQTWRNDLPLGLCVIAAESEDLIKHLPPNDPLSPILLAAAARGIYDLLASPQRGKPNLPRINKIFMNKQTTDRWHRQGIYITLKNQPSQKEWESLFKKFLEAGFLLPPVPSHPMILPGEMSDGEEAKLADALLFNDSHPLAFQFS